MSEKGGKEESNLNLNVSTKQQMKFPLKGIQSSLWCSHSHEKGVCVHL